ncbi:hypothetical protein PV328_007146 [Microctonus aethiopoides]|uniref:LIM zinc-binding domain-containing protein n=1 Tax=Microctonus aethiopoides TaxID=144406 RepID=A0AA39KUC6_9HYME|nr:hypothetical protein PV328_007146 [Microctonus aethiopoides]
MPSSQAAATERRNDRTITHEPPKLKTILKTPPKQATNPMQFVKVGPCSLYRTAQEQLQKVQEVKKIKQEVRDDPEDWQSNLDNWKSSRRKRQEHIIERVVEVKKLELEEHDRQRRRSKTFSEMMEERGSRGRKLSMSLAMYHEEDSNDLSDLGIGTSSGKSSVSGDTHDDTQSVLSDRDSEIDKNHSDGDNTTNENGNNNNENNITTIKNTSIINPSTITNKKPIFGNGFHNDHDQREYDSGTTATASSPEPEEYNYEGATRGYVNQVPQNIPRHLINLDMKFNNMKLSHFEEETSTDEKNLPGVKVDIHKRREIFENASQKNSDNKLNINNINNNNNNNSNNNNSSNNNMNNRSSGDYSNSISIKERLLSLEKQKHEADQATKTLNRLSGDMSSIRERLCYLEKQTTERDNKIIHKPVNDNFENVRSMHNNILSTSEKYSPIVDNSLSSSVVTDNNWETNEFSTKINNRLEALDVSRSDNLKKKSLDKPNGHFPIQKIRNNDNSTPSERSSSPDSEYRAPHAPFHRSLDSIDADASSGPDTFERVQSLEELDYVRRRYPTSASSAEILNDTDREDSGIHTADVSCSVSQADEPVDEEIVQHPGTIFEVAQEINMESQQQQQEVKITAQSTMESTMKMPEEKCQEKVDTQQQSVVIIEESIVIGSSSSSSGSSTINNTSNSSSSNEEAKSCCESPTPVDHEEEEVLMNDSTADIQSIDTTTVVCPMVNVEQKVHRMSPVTLPHISMIVDDTAVSNTLNYEILSAEKPSVTNNMEFIGTQFVLSNSIPPLNLTSDEEIVAGLTFPLGPPTKVEPPKEKPPPPPTDFSDDENQPIEPLKRLNSTRRIKKELRTRRSDFLGIEGINDDDFELSVAKPPDMAAILAEERRIEQLHRRSYDTDSNYEQDSGVELGHAEDWTKQPVSPDMSEHSRQSSEPFGASVASSEEDEITKKEREIIEVLEKEEQWRYGNDREQNSDIGEKLAYKLRELEEEKMQLERERAQNAEIHRQEETMRKNDKNSRKHDEELLWKQQQQQQLQQQDAVNQQEIVCIEELNLREENLLQNEKNIEEEEDEEEEQLRIEAERLRIHDELMANERRSAENRRKEEIRLRSIEDQLREQEKSMMTAVLCNPKEDEYASGEILRVERELLQLEQEELKRQRNNMAYREQKQQQLTEQLQEQWQSLQDVNNTSNIAHATYQNINMINYRSSMPNLQLHDVQRRRPAPPPIPPTKPIRLLEQRQRDVTIRNSRIPSADSIPQQVDVPMRHSISATALATHAGQQMTKQTLQALSAVPRTRIVKSDQWVQRRKSDGPRITQDYNYQHWLIQEAEQRRINEKNQRSAVRKPQQHVTGTSVLYTATSSKPEGKPLPDSIIQTLTQRMQNRAQERPPPPRRRMEHSVSQEHLPVHHQQQSQHLSMMHHKVHQSSAAPTSNAESQEKMLSVSGKKKCSHCSDELGRGAAMIIESLRLFYHMECFKCCVCHVRLGDGLMGTDVRVRNHKLHCHNCYSSDDGVKFSCV